MRPLLHLTVQLLALHPKLHITHLLSPTVAPRVKAELASSGFAYVYETDLSGKDSVGTSSVLDRIQLIEVQVAPNSDGIAGEPAPPKKGDLVEGLAAGAAPYAAAIAGYFSVLFGNAGGQGGAADIDNKFKDIVPTCVVYDVSLPLVSSSARAPPVKMSAADVELDVPGLCPRHSYHCDQKSARQDGTVFRIRT